MKINLPQTLSSKSILYATYYDNMSNQERQKVFQAYEYNRAKQIYELKHPELLDESTTKKLSEWEE